MHVPRYVERGNEDEFWASLLCCERCEQAINMVERGDGTIVFACSNEACDWSPGEREYKYLVRKPIPKGGLNF